MDGKTQKIRGHLRRKRRWETTKKKRVLNKK
jgi:hypothetical protein